MFTVHTRFQQTLFDLLAREINWINATRREVREHPDSAVISDEQLYERLQTLKSFSKLIPDSDLASFEKAQSCLEGFEQAFRALAFAQSNRVNVGAFVQGVSIIARCIRAAQDIEEYMKDEARRCSF